MSVSGIEIADYIGSTSVVYIGNGNVPESFVPSDHGNVICRVNRGIINGFAHIWVNGMLDPRKLGRWYKDLWRYMLRLNADHEAKYLRNYFNRADAPNDRTYFWNLADWLTATSVIGVARPMTGTLGIYWLTRYTDARLVVFGCDCFAQGGAYRVHEPKKDRAYLESLNQAGRIEYRSS
jgi:hypothetical protein